MVEFNSEHLEYLGGSLECCEELYEHFLNKGVGYTELISELVKLYNYDVSTVFGTLTYIVLNFDILNQVFFEKVAGEYVDLKGDKLTWLYITENEDDIYIRYRRV